MTSRRRNSRIHRNSEIYIQVSICPLRQSLISHRSESQRIYHSIGLCRGLCRVELTEAWMRHLSQKQNLQAAKPRNRLKLRSRDYMMTWRTREPRDRILHSPEKNLWRKLWMFEELAWKREMRTIDSFCWKEPRVILGSSTETKHHQRKMMYSVVASQPSSQSRFQRSVEPLNHSITLRMITGP